MLRLSKEKGLTLVEVLVALSVIAMIMVGVGSQMEMGSKVWQTEDSHTEALQNALIGLDKMTRELKQAQVIDSVSPPDVDTGFITFKGPDGAGAIVDKSFQYNNGYLEYNDGSINAQLAGPINSLRFICYNWSGVDPPDEPADIKLVNIELTARDQQASITVPVSSAVSLIEKFDSGQDDDSGGGDDSGGDDDGGDDDDGVFDLLDYAIFGGTGVSIKNNAWIGRHNVEGGSFIDREPNDANIGSFLTDISLNNVKVFGNVMTYGKVTISNNSYVRSSIYAGIDENLSLANPSILIEQSVDPPCGVMGDINTNGSTLMENNTLVYGDLNHLVYDYTDIGGSSYTSPVQLDNGAAFMGVERFSGLPDNFAINPFPDGQSDIPDLSLSPDITNSTANVGGVIDLQPGPYGNVTLTENRTLRLNVFPGNYTYYFNNIDAKNLTLHIVGVTSGSVPLWIFVKNDIKASQSLVMLFYDGAGTQIGNFNTLKSLAKMVYVEFGGNMCKTMSPVKGMCGLLMGMFFGNCLPGEINEGAPSNGKGNLILADGEALPDPDITGTVLGLGSMYARAGAALQHPSNNEPNPEAGVVPDLVYVPIDRDFLPPIWDNFK